MGLLTSKVLIVAIASAVAVATALGIVSAGRPSDDIRLTSNTIPMPPAAIAADCAGFPTAVVSNIGRLYKGNQAVTLTNMPEQYDAKVVIVHQAGGCLTEAAPKPAPGEVQSPIFLAPAVAILDVSDVKKEGLPLYIITEVKAPEGSLDRVFIALRLPKPEQVREVGDPARIA